MWNRQGWPNGLLYQSGGTGTMEAAGIQIVRTWKRDGTQNRMTLDAAFQSLRRTLATGRKYDIADRLLAGETLETAHARFTLVEANTH